VCACACACVFSLSLSSLSRLWIDIFVCVFVKVFFLGADLQVLSLCGARVYVGGEMLACSLTFVFVCVYVCMCVCQCVSFLSWIAVEICEFGFPSFIFSLLSSKLSLEIAYYIKFKKHCHINH
jgi:hypothetical protein